MSREIMQQALDALKNGKNVRQGMGSTKLQIVFENDAIAALEAELTRKQTPDELLRQSEREGWRYSKELEHEIKRLEAKLANPEQPDLRKAAEMALEALLRLADDLRRIPDDIAQTIQGLEAELAKPEQEPVKKALRLKPHECICGYSVGHPLIPKCICKPEYTAQPEHPLDKKAANARELGLDYEPEQVPIAYWNGKDGFIRADHAQYVSSWSDYYPEPLYASPTVSAENNGKPANEFKPDWDMIQPYHDRIAELEAQLALDKKADNARELGLNYEPEFDTPKSHIVKWSIPVDPNNFGEALAQPEQEPVAWIYNGNLHIFDPSEWAIEPESVQPLYTAPPKREWQSLTDDEIFKAENEVPDEAIGDSAWCLYFARAIEAKLREKNNA